MSNRSGKPVSGSFLPWTPMVTVRPSRTPVRRPDALSSTPATPSGPRDHSGLRRDAPAEPSAGKRGGTLLTEGQCGGIPLACRKVLATCGLGGLLLLCCMAAGVPAMAETSAHAFEEGVHYHRLPVAVDPQDPARIEVVEVFGYACVHCYRFDPILEDWRNGLPGDVSFRRVPAVFNETWALFGRMFYAAEALGVGEEMHMPLFDAIHRRGIDLRRLELAEELFASAAGVEPADFRAALNSFGVASRLRQADAHGRVYRVTGVPSLVVNGKYRIDSGDAEGHEGVLHIADFLIDMERTAQAE